MPVTTATGLARVTVNTPRRRLDVALPEQTPLADLLPDLLRHAGEGLPDAGQAHGGWGLRRGRGGAPARGGGRAPPGGGGGGGAPLGAPPGGGGPAGGRPPAPRAPGRR